MTTVDDSHVKPLAGSRTIDRVLRAVRDVLRTEPAARPLLTPEQFQEELAVLGLSGKRFGPEEYLAALERHLGISIKVHLIPDASYPELSRRLALSGRLGELRYSEELGLAVIFVPESLPPLVLNLTVLHELGHLAAGDLLSMGEEDPPRRSRVQGDEVRFATCRVRRGKKLAPGLPFADEGLRETEANLRARYALIAGSLGSASPYVDGMNDVL